MPCCLNFLNSDLTIDTRSSFVEDSEEKMIKSDLLLHRAELMPVDVCDFYIDFSVSALS